MKKFIVVILLLCTAYSASAQWYYRMYGVPTMDNLTEQQLNTGLQKATRMASAGTILTIGGAALVAGGVALIMTSIDADDWESGLQRAFLGGVLMYGGVIPVGIGVVQLIVGSSQKREIELSLVKFTGSASINGVGVTVNF